MPVYILDMLEIPAELKSAFEKGEFISSCEVLVVLVISALSVVHCTTK
jgi:hypothetical protein